jgi:hypothetical protein
VARFACISKVVNWDKPCLMLKGYVSLKSPCGLPHIRRWLGKCCICYPSSFGDAINLGRLVCVDKQLVTVGHLSRAGNSKTFTKDPKFIIKLLVDAIEGRDFEHHHQKDKV